MNEATNANVTETTNTTETTMSNGSEQTPTKKGKREEADRRVFDTLEEAKANPPAKPMIGKQEKVIHFVRTPDSRERFTWCVEAFTARVNVTIADGWEAGKAEAKARVTVREETDEESLKKLLAKGIISQKDYDRAIKKANGGAAE
jgi:hypothetical protein